MKRGMSSTSARYIPSTSSVADPSFFASGTANPAKRRKLRLSSRQQLAWGRVQEELAKEREKKVRLDWYLKELLVEMEHLIDQEREARAELGLGVSASDWTDGVQFALKLRTYKQYCRFDSDDDDTNGSPPTSTIAALLRQGEGQGTPSSTRTGIEAELGYEDYEDEDFMATMVSVHDLTEVSLTDPLSTEFVPRPPLAFVRRETTPSNNTAHPEGSPHDTAVMDTDSNALFESSVGEGLDISHFLNLREDEEGCGGDGAMDEEGDGYTASPSIDFGVAGGMGSESGEITLPKFGNAKTEEQRTTAMVRACTQDDSEQRESWKGRSIKEERSVRVKTESESGCSDWAFWVLDEIVSDTCP